MKIEFEIEKSVGYRTTSKSWIARIIGTDKTYIFSREFLETEPKDKAEMFKCRRKGKGTWTETAECGVGLYEITNNNSRIYRIVYETENGIKSIKINGDRATKIALLLDEGATLENARLATKAKEKQS
jgi:hypothetical protein